jgi:cell division protein FtsN
MKLFQQQRGGTFLGIIIGMIIGLGIAVGVALFITRAPIPFIDRAGTKTPTPVTATPGAALPDPNQSLYGKPAASVPAPAVAPETAPNTAPNTTSSTAPSTESTPTAPNKFSIYDLLPGKPAAESSAVKEEPAKEVKPNDKNRYLLQVGAYENETEADAMRAKLALSGFEASISKRERDGKTLHRVRIGPINSTEEMNRIRASLTQNGIETSVVPITSPGANPATGNKVKPATP